MFCEFSLPFAQVSWCDLLAMIAHSLCEMCDGKCLRTPWPGRVWQVSRREWIGSKKASERGCFHGWKEVPFGSSVVLRWVSMQTSTNSWLGRRAPKVVLMCGSWWQVLWRIGYRGNKFKGKRLRTKQWRNSPKSMNALPMNPRVNHYRFCRLKSSHMKPSRMERTKDTQRFTVCSIAS